MEEAEERGEEQGLDEFEELLDEYTYDAPRRGEFREAEVLRVDEDTVLLDVGAKRDAVVTRKDLSRLEDEDLDEIEPGDRIPVRVMRSPGKVSNKLEVSISRGLEREDWDRALELLESGDPVELKITGYNRGGLEVEFGRLRGFVPNSHITSIRRGIGLEKLRESKEEMVGDTILLKAIEVNQRRRRLVFSSRALASERRKRRLSELEVGQVIEGQVVNLVDFGAFVDLGGVDGLVHISELDWERVEHPSDVLSVGDELEVLVKDVDVERERVSLSRKALLPSPWDEIKKKYDGNDLVEGEVTNVVDFGAFVALPEGVEGLLHVSEMVVGGAGSPEEALRPGDKVLVRIVELNPEDERIGLSMQQVTYDEQMAWMEAQREAERSEEEPAADEEPVAEQDQAYAADEEQAPDAAVDEVEASDEEPKMSEAATSEAGESDEASEAPVAEADVSDEAEAQESTEGEEEPEA